MTIGNDNGTDGQTDRRTDRVRRNMRPPPREEGCIINKNRQIAVKIEIEMSISILAKDNRNYLCLNNKMSPYIKDDKRNCFRLVGTL